VSVPSPTSFKGEESKERTESCRKTLGERSLLWQSFFLAQSKYFDCYIDL